MISAGATANQVTRNSLVEFVTRARFVAFIVAPLFLGGMIAWFFPFDDAIDRSGTPLGGDYVMLYVAGQTVCEGNAIGIYDDDQQSRRLQRLFPGIDPETCRLPFRYPPLVAILMAPLSCLPFPTSFFLFTTLSAIAGMHAVRTFVRLAVDSEMSDCPARDMALRGVLSATCTWPVVCETMCGGQLSLFGLAVLAQGLKHVQRGEMFRCGAILALASYKPNLLAFVVLGIVLRYPRAAFGVAANGLLLTAVQWIVAGWPCLKGFLQLGATLALRTWNLETPFWKVHGMGAWLRVLPSGCERPVLLAIGIAATVILSLRSRRSDGTASFARFVTCLLLINALCNPYLPIYDLSLLAAIPFLIATDSNRIVSLASGLAGQFLMAACYFGPHLSQAIAPWLGIQCFPLLLLAILLSMGWTCGWKARDAEIRPHFT